MNDTIYRQAAIDAILHNKKVYIDEYTIAIIDNDAQTIARLPSAQPERLNGRWKGEGLGDYRCSLCGKVTRHARTNFCPNCGAEMRGEEE